MLKVFYFFKKLGKKSQTSQIVLIKSGIFNK